jgi:hypothetical protein
MRKLIRVVREHRVDVQLVQEVSHLVAHRGKGPVLPDRKVYGVTVSPSSWAHFTT